MAVTTVLCPPRILLACLCLLLASRHVHSSSVDTSTTPQPPQVDAGGGGKPAVAAPRLTGRNLHNLIPDSDSNSTFFIPDIDSYSNTQLYALLVDILEKLNVLVPKAPSCYQLQKIVHEVIVDDDSGDAEADSGSQNVGVFLYFKESQLSPPSSDVEEGSVPASQGNGTQAETGGTKVTPGAKPNNECVSEPALFLPPMDAQPLMRDNHTQDQTAVNGSAGPHTGPNGDYRLNGDEDDEDDDRFGGLSKTQVVVISTCSAIISTFFIVAFVLRVRNYIKRVREEQQQARRPTFRSCSVRLRSVSHSNEHVRRDSQVSKLSHQSNQTSRGPGYSLTNGSTSRDHSNASSPHHDPDTKPLLLVTAVTEGQTLHSPSVSQSSSLQYIDEEPRRKTERPVSRAVNGDDSEARPLLASSEVSANSLHLSPTSPTSEATSVGTAPSSLNGNHSSSIPGSTPVSINGPTTTSSKGLDPQSSDGLAALAADGQSCLNNRGLEPSDSTDCTSPVWRDGSPSEEPGTAPVSGEKPVEKSEFKGTCQKVKETSDPEDGLREPVRESAPHVVSSRADDKPQQRPSEADSLVQIPLIHFCGLTQSDSSLSSLNGSHLFRYGVQTEYTPPDLGYFSATECLNGMNAPYQAVHFLNNSDSILFSTNSISPTDTPSVNSGNISPCPPVPGLYSTHTATTADNGGTVVQTPVLDTVSCQRQSPNTTAAVSQHSPSTHSATPLSSPPYIVPSTDMTKEQAQKLDENSESVKVDLHRDTRDSNSGLKGAEIQDSFVGQQTGKVDPISDNSSALSACAASEKHLPSSSCEISPSSLATADTHQSPCANSHLCHNSDLSCSNPETLDRSVSQAHPYTNPDEQSEGKMSGSNHSIDETQQASSASESMVVMDKLFSTDDERTTFL